MKPHFKSKFVVALICVLIVRVRSAAAEDWPLVRGDIFGSGVAKSAVPEAPELLWKHSAGKDAGFDATAVIADGVIYAGDNAGTLHAIRLADGSQVWKKEIPESGFGAGAAVEKGRIYIGDINGALFCLNAADGAEVWSKKLEGEVYAGPTLNGDDVLFTSESGTLSCRNKQTGEERWKFHIEAPLRCTPTIAAGRAAVAGCDSKLHLIDVSDGKEIETVDIDAPTGSTPAMQNERVYFGTEGGTFYAISFPHEGSKGGAVAWQYRDPQRNQPIRAAAAINDQIVVYGGQGKTIYALNPATGEEKWKLPTRARVESSPVIAGNRVVAATAAGKIYLLDVPTGEIKWEHDAGGSFIASPAVVDGRIILGNTDGTLYCFGARAKYGLTTKDTKSTKGTK
jgi:outer membrane protein assembly factor BamB